MDLERLSRRSSPGPTSMRGAVAYEEKRRSVRSSVLGEGTLACPSCDAPIAIGPEPVCVRDRLACAFCEERGPAAAFLSLSAPTRPARVLVRVRLAGGSPQA